MNSGTMVTNALQRAFLPVNDFTYRELAFGYLNEVCQEAYELVPAKHRKAVLSITTASGTEEYALSKHISGIESIVQNSMRGTDPIRNIEYKPASEFFRTRQYSSSGNPYEYREGILRNYATAPSAASVISFTSSVSNITTGTVAVTYGSKRVVFSSGVITIDVLGRWFRVGSDSKRYQIVSFETSQIAILSDAYEGATASGASYKIGDVQQKAIVYGTLSNGVYREEEVQLDGENAVSTVNQFLLQGISKSDKTAGYITATSNAGAVTNIILDPNETEANYQTIKFYPIPSATETINYEALRKHPYLYKNTDSPLFPTIDHPFLQLDLYIRLETEINKKDVSAETIRRRDSLKFEMISRANNTDNWSIRQEYEAEAPVGTNLPGEYPADDY